MSMNLYPQQTAAQTAQPMFKPGRPPAGSAYPGYNPIYAPGSMPPIGGGAPIGAGAPVGGGGGGIPVSPAAAGIPGMLPAEESYVENILRLNLGKVGTFYMTYENNSEWNAKVFRGVIEAAGRDHIIISDPKTGMRFLLLMVNLDYVTFDEPLQYTYPYPFR